MLIFMLEKVKIFLGFGKAHAATLIREIIKGHESQAVLFEAGNEHVLAAFVEYGHEFSPRFAPAFLQNADRKLVKTYLEIGFELNDKAKQAVIDRKDDELVQIMIDSGSWAPFPFGSCMHHSSHKHHDLEHEHHEEIAEPALMSAVGSA